MLIQVWKRELKTLATSIEKYSKTVRPLNERSRARLVALIAHAAHVERLLRQERRLTSDAWNLELKVGFFPLLEAQPPRHTRLQSSDYAQSVDHHADLRAGEVCNVLIHMTCQAVVRNPRTGEQDLLCTSPTTSRRHWCLSVRGIASWLYASAVAVDGDDDVQVEHLEWSPED